MTKVQIIANWVRSCNNTEQLQNINRFVSNHPQFNVHEKLILSNHILNMMRIKF